jgi:DNA polymerase III epsilon subunit-like protein
MGLVSVDIEASGATPARSNMIAIGATALVGTRPSEWPRFYITLKPRLADGFEPDAMQVHGLTEKALMQHGEEPLVAMLEFRYWLHWIAEDVTFVAYNSPFDWMFVAFYFDYYIGMNPFGHNGINIPDVGVGKLGRRDFNKLRALVRKRNANTHNALHDAINQGELYQELLHTT